MTVSEDFTDVPVPEGVTRVVISFHGQRRIFDAVCWTAFREGESLTLVAWKKDKNG